jgi:hypothetical protein
MTTKSDLEASQTNLAKAKVAMTKAIEAYQQAAYANVEAQAAHAAAQGFSKERFIACKMDDVRNLRAQWSGGADSPPNIAESIMREAIAGTCTDIVFLCEAFPNN